MSAVPVAVTTLATDAFTTTNTPPVGTAIVVTWSVIASMVLMALIILILAKACGLLRSRRKKTMINAERTAKQGHQSMMSQSDIELGKKGIRQQMEDLMRQQVESEKHATEMPSERKATRSADGDGTCIEALDAGLMTVEIRYHELVQRTVDGTEPSS